MFAECSSVVYCVAGIVIANVLMLAVVKII